MMGFDLRLVLRCIQVILTNLFSALYIMHADDPNVNYAI